MHSVIYAKAVLAPKEVGLSSQQDSSIRKKQMHERELRALP